MHDYPGITLGDINKMPYYEFCYRLEVREDIINEIEEELKKKQKETEENDINNFEG